MKVKAPSLASLGIVPVTIAPKKFAEALTEAVSAAAATHTALKRVTTGIVIDKPPESGGYISSQLRVDTMHGQVDISKPVKPVGTRVAPLLEKNQRRWCLQFAT
jgi:mannose-1-phosphate guanylyltransferase